MEARRIKTDIYDEPHLTAPPKRAAARWGTPLTQAILWLEGAIVLLLGSIIFGMRVLPWLID